MSRRRNFVYSVIVAAVAGIWGASPAEAETAPAVAWKRQIGTTSSDPCVGVAVDGAGNAFISGYTYGSLGGTNSGKADAFLTKFDAAGMLQWSRQIGTAGDEMTRGMAVDGAGNAFITGVTTGSLGGTSSGDTDAFLIKYNAAGTLLWSRQIGTTNGEEGWGVAVDGAGNAFMTGYTYNGSLGGTNAGMNDAILVKYDAAGTLLWARQIGTTSRDISHAVAVDRAGNAFITGRTGGSLGGTSSGGTDAFLIKYDAAGTLQWSRQIGTTSSDISYGVAVDGAGNAFITGYTSGSLDGPNAGLDDAFLVKYDATGTLLWSRQIGTAGDESGYSYGNVVNVDDAGNVFITGSTPGSLGGANSGSVDAYLVKYDAAGTLLWSSQLGTTVGDVSYGVDVDGAGNVFISGWTHGSLSGTNSGGSDAFLVKYDGGGVGVPEPGSIGLLAVAAMGLLARRRRP